MPSTVRRRLLNRAVLAAFALEVVVWLLWVVPFRGLPLPPDLLIDPVVELSTAVGRAMFGCRELGCIPFVVAGVLVSLFAVAVVVGNCYEWVRTRA